MQFEYAEVATEDGLRLPAAFFEPASPAGSRAVDAILLLPGTYGTFHDDAILKIAQLFREAGFPALTLSTRGHDAVWRDIPGKRHLGAAYESVADCHLDCTGAIAWLASRGHGQVALFGHHIGGTKSLYYAAGAAGPEPHPALAAVISSGGPRWSASVYASSGWAENYQKNRTTAEDLVKAGRGDEMFEMTFPFGPSLITGNQFVDRYCTENYNVASWAQNIRVPALRIDSELESGILLLHSQGFADDLLRMASNPHNKAVMMAGANHDFTGKLPEVAATVVEWINGLPASAA